MKRVVDKREVTSSDLSFGVVIGRLKMAVGTPTDAALCSALGMASNTFANRKNSGSIPFDLVIALCVARSVNIDWVFTGDGAAFKDGRAVNAPELIDKKLLTTIILELQRAWNSHTAAQVSESHIARLALLAAGIYNNLVFEPNEETQQAVARQDAQAFARLAKLSDEADDAVKR